MASVLGLVSLAFGAPLAGVSLGQASLVCLAVAGFFGVSSAKSQAKPEERDDLA